MKRALTIIPVLLWSCDSNPIAPEIPSRVIGYGAYTVSSPGVTTVRTSGPWQDFIRETGLRAPSGRPDDPIPAVDFSSEMAVGAFLGARPSSAHRIRVDRVVKDSRTLTVYATEEIGCVGLTVITYPLTVVAVPQSSDTVSVVWTTARLPCQ